MASLLVILAAAIFGAAIGMFALLVIGIRRDDGAKTLTDSPRSHVETVTRRMLGVGVRIPNSDISDEEES